MLHGERGQALVEFTLVLPILLALVTAIVEFGIAYNHYVTLTDAARVGARAAAVSLDDPVTAGRTAARRSAAGLDPTITVTTDTTDVTVTASEPETISIFGFPILTVDLSSTTTERREQ